MVTFDGNEITVNGKGILENKVMSSLCHGGPDVVKGNAYEHIRMNLTSAEVTKTKANIIIWEKEIENANNKE